MKPSITLFLGVLVVLGWHQAALAQRKEAAYSEVFRMEQAALSLLRSLPHRSTTTHEVVPEVGKDPTYKSILTYETIPPDRSRSVQENVTPASFKRMETIFVAGRFYQKFDGRPWFEREPPPPPVPIETQGTTRVSKPRFENNAWLLETLTEKGRLVSVYETKSKSTREVDGKEITQITTSRYWFRDDGILFKKTSQLETVGDPKILRNTAVYDYDDIKIEAPIINQ